MLDFTTPLPASPAAKEAGTRAWPLFDRMRAMLTRAEVACSCDRDSEMCGELEDLERLISVVLRGHE